jgi:hypothetical protein
VAQIAGGYTSWEGIGGWISPEGLLEEPVLIVEASLANDAAYSSEHGLGALRQLAHDICRDEKQDCVFLSFNGKVEYVRK